MPKHSHAHAHAAASGTQGPTAAVDFISPTLTLILGTPVTVPAPLVWAGIVFIGFFLFLTVIRFAVVIKKVRLWTRSLAYMVMSKDQPKIKSGAPGAPGTLRLEPLKLSQMTAGGSDPNVVKVQVIFVRHGESVWNSLFNKFDLGWPMRALKCWYKETKAFFFDANHSELIDTPLSSKGKKQAKELAQYLQNPTGGQVTFPFDPASSVVVCSNLRRAMETALIGLEPRLGPNKEKIIIDSNLQEGSRNVDAQAMAVKPFVLPCYPLEGVASPTNAVLLSRLFDASRCNFGNKKMSKGNNVFLRIQEFTKRLFGQGSSHCFNIHGGVAGGYPVGVAGQIPSSVIVVGHSLYFRNFFRTFLKPASTHKAKSHKIQNCGAVAFELELNNTTGEVWINEGSIKELFKGFAK